MNELQFHKTNEACPLCKKTEGNRTFQASEKMYGTGEEFNYLECGSCNALSLLNVPAELGNYYPSDYYSYSSGRLYRKGLIWHMQNLIMRSVLNHRSGNGGPFGAAMAEVTGKFRWVRPGILNRKSAVLDVGCGGGSLLLLLQRAGYKNLTGVDPFIEKDLHYNDGLVIHRKELSEMDRTFDFIMLNHTFEHLAKPGDYLRTLRSKLKSGGKIMIRIPVANCHAWRKYGTNWVQLDAPRHLHLHTAESMLHLSNQAGLKIDEVVYDSSAFQFVGSEKYLKGLPLEADADFIPKSELRRFKKEAEILNSRKEGDTATFYLSA